MSLQIDLGPILLCLLFLRSILLYSTEELLSRSRFLDVFDSDIDAFLKVPVPNLLVDDNTDSILGDVVDDASLSVVDFVWHTIELLSKLIVLPPPCA